MPSTPPTRERLSGEPSAAPVLPVLAALIVGILLDSMGAVSLFWWCVLVCGFSAGWIWSFRRQERWSAACLLLAVCATGGAWHHCQTGILAADDLSVFVKDEPVPCWLQARVLTVPFISQPPRSVLPTAIPQQARTICQLEALGFRTPTGWQAVSGNVRLEVRGQLPEMVPGTLLEVTGLLRRPGPARNPGDFDFQSYLHTQGIHTVLRGEFPEAVRIIKSGGTLGFWTTWRSRVQARCAERLGRYLRPDSRPLAVAMLLGPRSDISWDLRTAFQNSGTLHFLAISGINVAILVACVWPFLRLLGWSTPTQSWGLMGMVVCYVAVTEADPPVLRAAILMLVWLWGRASGALLAPLNHLALAGLLLLLWRPVDLFHPGAQLSFLAVLGLHWAAQWESSLTRSAQADDEPAILRGEPVWWWRLLGEPLIWIGKGLLATTAVWVVTVPLVLARFHLLSLVGFALNIVLSVWMTWTLWCGYLLLILGSLWPPLGWPLARLFELGLDGFLIVVRETGSWPWGHLLLPGPAEWWIAGNYALLVPLVCRLWRGRTALRGWQLWGGWCIFGLLWGWPPAETGELRCTTLAVGHGAAVVLELPQGETWLYDAGSLQSATRAGQIIQGYLGVRGCSGIDVLWLSHADLDHFNAVPELVRNLHVRTVCITPAFLRSSSPGSQQMLAELISSGVQIRTVWSGDTVAFEAAGSAGRQVQSPRLAVEVLHPPAQAEGGKDDQHSLVLSLRYGSHSLLLMGDLEREGLTEFLQQSPRQHAVLLAPHHGSLGANTFDLARWAAPRHVIVSGGSRNLLEPLQQIYGSGAIISSTVLDGAVTSRFFADGQYEFEHFVDKARFSSARIQFQADALSEAD